MEANNTRPRTISVPEAGREYFGIGRDASYEAARRGEIPAIRIGRLLRVPLAAMERRLEEVGTERRRELGPLDAG
ncbi:MAG: helix-turn-helix domain-containing protein [Proteobacteria bacterium]|nr:helix-turn-helix domain-containing protein [Pseudomonadota bacterium]